MALSTPRTHDSLSQASCSEQQSTRSVAEAHQVRRDYDGCRLSHVKHFLLSEAVLPFFFFASIVFCPLSHYFPMYLLCARDYIRYR